MLKKFVTMSQVFITTHLGQERFGCVIVAKSFNLLLGVKVLSRPSNSKDSSENWEMTSRSLIQPIGYKQNIRMILSDEAKESLTSSPTSID